MEITKMNVKSDRKLLYIGTKDGEEYYQEHGKKGGWSFMGLRPATEKELRARQRERTPEDFMDIPAFVSHYFDYERYADDMEEWWYENHDVQAERVGEDGETLYLGFGSGQSMGSYFERNGIIDYATYLNHFDSVGLTQEEFRKAVIDYIQ